MFSLLALRQQSVSYASYATAAVQQAKGSSPHGVIDFSENRLLQTHNDVLKAVSP